MAAIAECGGPYVICRGPGFREYATTIVAYTAITRCTLKVTAAVTRFTSQVCMSAVEFKAVAKMIILVSCSVQRLNAQSHECTGDTANES